MASTSVKALWAKAIPLRSAWREFADLGCEGLMLFKRYEVLTRGWIDGEPSDEPPHVWQEFEPKNSRERSNLAEHRLNCLYRKLLDHLAEGELIAYAKRLKPSAELVPCELPSGLFAAQLDGLEVSWESNIVAIGDNLFGDVRITLAKAKGKRGKPQMHVDLKAAALVAAMQWPDFYQSPPKVAHERTLEIMRSHAQFAESRAKNAHIKTFRPVFAKLKRAQTTPYYSGNNRK